MKNETTIKNIDFAQLKQQKQILIYMIEDWSRSFNEQKKEDAKTAQGLLSLIDQIEDYTEIVTITKHTSHLTGKVHISTRNPFFKDRVIVKDHGDKITFTRPSFSYIGECVSPKLRKTTNNYVLSLESSIPLGDYYFDEDESTEDEKVIYYK